MRSGEPHLVVLKFAKKSLDSGYGQAGCVTRKRLKINTFGMGLGYIFDDKSNNYRHNGLLVVPVLFSLEFGHFFTLANYNIWASLTGTGVLEGSVPCRGLRT